MKGKKIIFLSLLLMTSVSSDDIPNKSTLTTFKLQSSKVLPNFQGQGHTDKNPFKYVIPMEYEYHIEHELIEDKSYNIRQISENSFEVLGSPIEWGSNNDY